MSIASKINTALCCVFACGALATYGVLQTTIKPRFDAIERDAARLNHERVTNMLSAVTDRLAAVAEDYASSESLTPPELKTAELLGLSALMAFSPDGAVMWRSPADFAVDADLARAIAEVAQAGARNFEMAAAKPATERGLVWTSEGIFLLAIAPAVRRDDEGARRGAVIAAKALDVAAIEKLTSVAFTLEDLPLSFPRQPADALTVESNAVRIQTTSILRSVTGAPLVRLTVATPRDVSRAGGMAINSAMLMMLGAAVAAMAVLWAYLRSAVAVRIAALNAHFATAADSGAIRCTEIGVDNDEISDLANSFNAMAEQVNRLRCALNENAYASGLSEWAGGTLHNVRNGLTPISTMTWQVEKLYGGAWLGNLRSAIDDLSRSDTPDDRRAKLNSYLLGSASRLIDAADRTTDFARRINGASRNVIEMVSQFERYANRKAELEPVDLLTLLKATVEASGQARSGALDIVLPSATAKIRSNGVILRQIIGNVLINAVESTHGQPRRGRVEMTITAQRSGMTRIAVTDNGAGFAPERLADLFKRSDSSRSSRGAGLGLHWCANACKIVGASMAAASAGPGFGATVIIDLPSLGLDHKEAA